MSIDRNDGDLKPVHVYGKSFYREESGHKRIVESVIIFRDGENISIGIHNKDANNFVKQIKTADDIVYCDESVSRVASLVLKGGGGHVRLYGINTEAINSHYNKEKILSISQAARNSAGENMKAGHNKEEKIMAAKTQATSAPAELNPERPFESNVSEKKFSGIWIPYHNAKTIREAMDNGTAPFLPNEKGEIDARPIYNANTGYCLNAKDLIPLQVVAKNNPEADYSTIVATKSGIDAAHTSVKAGEKGFFYNFKRGDGTIGTSQFFFPEQTEHPDRVIDTASKKISAVRSRNLENGGLSRGSATIEITSPDTEEYLAKYMAACKTYSKLKCAPEVAAEFKKNFSVVLDNQFAKKGEFKQEVGNLNNLLFNADKKSVEIVRQMNAESREARRQKTPEKKHKVEMSVSR